jgi:hypothetical protein
MENTEKWYFCEHEDEAEIICSVERPKMTYDGGKWSSMSCTYDSKEELLEKLGILPEPCRCCGKLVRTHYVPETKKKLIEANICFLCNYWEERIEMGKQKKSIVVNHTAYTAHPRPAGHEMQMLGFGGSKFQFKRFGSEDVEECTNMWFQGPIPERFWDRLPDNAEFVKP